MKGMEEKGPRELQGIAVSPGIIIGKAHLVDRSRMKILYQYLIGEDQIQKELKRFQEAISEVENQLVTLKRQMSDQLKQHSLKRLLTGFLMRRSTPSGR